jgi:hypothetical protein
MYILFYVYNSYLIILKYKRTNELRGIDCGHGETFSH